MSAFVPRYLIHLYSYLPLFCFAFVTLHKIVLLFAAKRSRVELTSTTVDLLQQDGSVFSELVSQSGASLPVNGSPVQLCKTS